MIVKYLLPLLALAGAGFAVRTVLIGSKPVPVAAPAALPATSPWDETIAAAGIVEASTRNVAVATPLAGVVAEVRAAPGTTVGRGDELFRIDDRAARAELEVRQAALARARADLARLEALPRAEDLPPAQARVEAAQAALANATSRLELAESLPDARAISREELELRRWAVRDSRARVDEARSALELLRAGAWAPDLESARAAVASAQALLRAQEIELERHVVRAPFDGTVLQADVRAGEFAPAGPAAQALVLLGDTSRLHVRVDIDENDAWRFRAGSRAEACVRGNRELRAELEFVRIEPYVVPKRSLTGESTERVDTRVLQVLYAFDPATLAVHVGQQMDVFVEAGATR